MQRTVHNLLPASMSMPTWPAEVLFEKFYAEVFRPHAAWHISEYRLRVYDQAVHRLIAHCGGVSPTLGATTLELIDECVTAQLAGRGQDWRNSIRCALLRIRRAWNPADICRDRAPPADIGTLRRYFEDCYRPERLVCAKAQTIIEYRIALRKLNEHLGRDVLLDELRDALFAGFFDHLAELGRRPHTIAKYRAMLYAMWHSAYQAGLTDRLPRMRKPRLPRERPDAWSLDEIRRIFSAATQFRRSNLSEFYGDVPCRKWWAAALLTVYETAIRRSSLFAIQHDSLELKSGLLYIAGDEMKNNQGKEFQLSHAAIEAIRAIWRPRREFIFYCDTSVKLPSFANRVEDDFKRILRLAEVPRRRRRGLCYWHKLRRTSATRICAAGGLAAASMLLGHSSEYVTERYIDRSQLPKNDATGLLPGLSGN